VNFNLPGYNIFHSISLFQNRSNRTGFSMYFYLGACMSAVFAELAKLSHHLRSAARRVKTLMTDSIKGEKLYPVKDKRTLICSCQV